MGASAPEASPPPPVSAPDEGSMIVEDQLIHNFMLIIDTLLRSVKPLLSWPDTSQQDQVHAQLSPSHCRAVLSQDATPTGVSPGKRASS